MALKRIPFFILLHQGWFNKAILSVSVERLSRSYSPAAAFRRDRPAHRRPGRHGGAEHTAPGRGAEGGATGRPHRGRLRPGEQDGEGLSGHPPGHRLHRLPVHPLRSGGGVNGCSQSVPLCERCKNIWGR